MTSTTGRSELARNSLGVPGVVFLVLAAVAPLTGIVVVAALGIALGNGAGMVAAFLAVTVVLLLFAVGYARMSREVVSAGGFYAYTVKGLGRPVGLGAGLTALIGYNFFVAGAVGTSGFFMQSIIADLTGLDVHWFVWSAVSVVAAFLLSRQGIDFSAKVLGIALVLEVSILLVFDVSVLVRTGFSFEVFSPGVAFSGALGVSLLFAANAFVGFEATSLFSEEARNPLRTIPRATFIAIVFIGAFAAFTTWAIVSAAGTSAAQQSATDHLATGDFVFSLSQNYLGTILTDVMMVLLLVSLFAALMALHNSATRYIFSLGRVRILPRVLGSTLSNGFPQLASMVQLLFAIVVAGLFAVNGLEPISSLIPSMTGFGTLAILVLQLLAALAIVVHFRRRRDPRLLSTFVAPLLGLIGLIGIVVLAVVNFPTLAGSDAPVIGLLPLLLPIAMVSGLLLAVYLRYRRPDIYRGLESDIERPTDIPAPGESVTGVGA
ncbi:APC family permease [Rhodococcus fascians]|nr:APC family permease [Rhodococcus fascians]MBY4239447.1 APC family permease [Rhodococcus fascians]MBY4254970.1 APC family permease [Rhodococcus fascians]MBY4270803.1 APC family permease [Rhodococcus fascians]